MSLSDFGFIMAVLLFTAWAAYAALDKRLALSSRILAGLVSLGMAWMLISSIITVTRRFI